MTEETLNKGISIKNDIEKLVDAHTELSNFSGKIDEIKVDSDMDLFSLSSIDVEQRSLHAMRRGMAEAMLGLIEELEEEFNSL